MPVFDRFLVLGGSKCAVTVLDEQIGNGLYSLNKCHKPFGKGLHTAEVPEVVVGEPDLVLGVL